MRHLNLLLIAATAAINANAADRHELQTDWSGGGGVPGPVSAWSDTFESADGVAWRTVGGRIMLSSAPISEPVGHILGDDMDGAIKVYAADVDLDGDTDILGVSYWDDRVELFLNDGGHPPGWTRQVIAEDFERALAVSVADIDGDGLPDVVSVAWLGERIAWWRSDGDSPPNWTGQTIATGFTGAHWVRLTDMDSDGRLDVVGAAMDRREVAWWRNDGGDPVQWQKIPLPGPLAGAVSVFPSDLDGDGDMDVAASGWSTSGGVVWWENRDGGGTDWQVRVVDRPFGESSSVHVADIDGDGAADLLASSWSLDSLGWWHISEPVEEGTISSSILDCGGPMEWTLCHWTADLPGDAEIRVEGRVSADSSSMGPWIELQPGPVSGHLESGTRHLQYRVHLIRGPSAMSPVVYDIQFTALEVGLPAPRRPSRRVAP